MSIITLPKSYRILLVDDEPDVHAMNKLTLRSLEYEGHQIEIVQALSGREAIEFMRTHPDTAVILLDVVMESTHAGLDACQAIRTELNNQLVRIVLMTGQPGAAPERKVIVEYDIDGYLAKADTASNRLYTTVRTSLKAFHELIQLERHRQILNFLHRSLISLHSFDPLAMTLQQILETAVVISPSPLVVLNLETFDESNDLSRYKLHFSTNDDKVAAAIAAEQIIEQVAANAESKALREGGAFGAGFIIPILLHRNLGQGWMYLEGEMPDRITTQTLQLLSGHAANALYASVAQNLLEAREEPFFESITI